MKKQKILALIAVLLSLVVCVFCGVYLFRQLHKKSPSSSELPGEEVAVVQEVFPQEEPIEAEQPSAELGSEPGPEGSQIVVPVDFPALQAVNPETYGWIHIPDTVIDYPVMQHKTDDRYYLSHTPEGDYSLNGSIFSEHVYNSATFDDPVVILYGHDDYNSSEMFTQLNNFRDADYFDEHPELFIYAPGRIYRYDIVAAFPFSDQHIFYNRLLDTEEKFDRFFESLPEAYTFDSNFREELFPAFDDRTLILSTCYRKNHKQRFLVIGVCSEIRYDTTADETQSEETK